jgi:type IX secretion system substrate protein/PKD domain-containing protein
VLENKANKFPKPAIIVPVNWQRRSKDGGFSFLWKKNGILLHCVNFAGTHTLHTLPDLIPAQLRRSFFSFTKSSFHMQKRLYLLLLSAFIFSSLNSQTGCPGCVTELPPLPEDTIYISPAPDGVAGQYYDGDISFRMPKTTTPVNATDPGTPPGLNISKITIITAANLPPGLDWEASQLEFDPGNETDGCVKFCGTPLQPGLYEVKVFVTAEVLLISQSTSFSFPLYIAPAASSNDGFAMQNSAGCGAVTVSFQNNIPSLGNPGYSYIWDFGNGTTSAAENPDSVTYDTPGIYPVAFEAAIDTFGYMLTTVQVLDVGCGDVSLPPIFNGAPDLYLKIQDPDGNQILQTNVVSNAPVPFIFTLNLPIIEGDYTLEVRDDDTFGSDGCGTVTFNQLTTDTLVDGNLFVQTDIIHPVSTIHSADTVVVYPFPAAPEVEPNGALEICDGTGIELMTNYATGVQWYRDTSLLFAETAQSIIVDQAGNYWVEYTSEEGCKSASEMVGVTLIALPFAPAFHNENNLLELNDPDLLPVYYTLQWYQDGQLVEGATDVSLCMTSPGTSLYTLEVTDLDSGCSNSFSLGATLDPAYDCTVPTEDLVKIENSFTLFPNPANGWLRMQFDAPASADVILFNAMGQAVFLEKTEGGWFDKTWDLSGVPAGLYSVSIRTADGIFTKKIVVQR